MVVAQQCNYCEGKNLSYNVKVLVSQACPLHFLLPAWNFLSNVFCTCLVKVVIIIILYWLTRTLLIANYMHAYLLRELNNKIKK